jgi:hypothetical protein
MSLVEPLLAAPTIGVLGRTWRASVTSWGAVVQWDDLGTLDWYVAADDRWHVPADEPTVRQSLVDGTPVVETRLRIPQGDAVQRVYAVADHSGLTVIEVENDSPMPIAVAFTGVPLLSLRPPADMEVPGIDLPADAVVFPVGHHATLTVAIAHDRPRVGTLPGGLPSAIQVARGWTALCERASRLLVPDESLAQRVVRERCQLMLDGPADTAAQPVEFLLGVSQLVRMGSVADEWIPEVAEAVAALVTVRDHPLLGAAIDAAEHVCAAAGERRAVRDLAKVRHSLSPGTGVPPRTADGIGLLTWLERTIATGADLFPAGIPTEWLGNNFEVYGVPTGPSSSVSFALRWHGERPAVLWECTGEPVTLGASLVAPDWSSAERTGETLWPTPPGAVPVLPTDDEPAAGSQAGQVSPITPATPIVPAGDDISFS